MIFEVVAESLEEAKIAQLYGAKRVELCSALDIGGLSPGPGLMAVCVKKCMLEIHAMIRPRGGGFVYNADEIETMEHDISFAAQSGCKGVVLGLLLNNGTVDIENTLRLIRRSKKYGLEVTFHRAIDFCTDIYAAMESIIQCGADRILTAGHPEGVDAGINVIANLIAASAKRIQIMPGGGVSISNIEKLTSLMPDAVHFNVRKLASVSGMGNEYTVDEEKIKEISKLMNIIRH